MFSPHKTLPPCRVHTMLKTFQQGQSNASSRARASKWERQLPQNKMGELKDIFGGLLYCDRLALQTCTVCCFCSTCTGKAISADLVTKNAQLPNLLLAGCPSRICPQARSSARLTLVSATLELFDSSTAPLKSPRQKKKKRQSLSNRPMLHTFDCFLGFRVTLPDLAPHE